MPHACTHAQGEKGKKPAIHVWNLKRLDCVRTLVGYHTRGVRCMAFSADGKLLVSVGSDDGHSIALWNWRSARRLSDASLYSATELLACSKAAQPWLRIQWHRRPSAHTHADHVHTHVHAPMHICVQTCM